MESSSVHSKSDTHFWCVHCLRRYSTKQKYLQHFGRPEVQENENQEDVSKGGRQVANPCYNRNQGKQYGKTKAEAMMLKKQMEDGALLRFFKTTLTKRKDDPMMSEHESDSDQSRVENDSSTVIENPSTVTQNPSTVSENPAPISCSDIFHKPDAPPVFSQISDRFRMPSTDSSPSVVTSVGSSASVEQLNSKIDEVSQTSNKILTLLQSLELGRQGKSKSDQPTLDDQPSWFQSEHCFDEQIQLIKSANSMHSIMRNPLVNGIFCFAKRDEHGNLALVDDSNEIEETEHVFDGGNCYLVCQLCHANSPKHMKGMRVLDKDYKKGGKCFEEWFRDFKKSIRKHIELDNHSKALKEYEKKIKDISNEIDGVKKNDSVSHLLLDQKQHCFSSLSRTSCCSKSMWFRNW
jgi:hypothetical protein